MTYLGLLGVALMIAGGLTMIVYSLIYYVKAFKVSVLVGLLNLLTCVFYLFNDFKEAGKSFVLAWVGCFILLGSGILTKIQGFFEDGENYG